jgi:hypothetical protein
VIRDEGEEGKFQKVMDGCCVYETKGFLGYLVAAHTAYIYHASKHTGGTVSMYQGNTFHVVPAQVDMGCGEGAGDMLVMCLGASGLSTACQALDHSVSTFCITNKGPLHCVADKSLKVDICGIPT